MEDIKRIRLSGPAISVRGNDIDTDRIIPARFLRCVTFEDLGAHAFEDDRKSVFEKGGTHPFDEKKFVNARILFVNKNFGCGSSREHAPQAIMRWSKGITAVVGESFAEIFLGNCVSLGVPCVVVSPEHIHQLQDANEANPDAVFEIDLKAKTIKGAGLEFPVEIADGTRQQFLEGRWDSSAELLEGKDQILATAAKLPYFNNWAS